MRLFRIVSMSVLSVALCLFLAWGAMVIVHAGEEKTSAIGEYPAAESVSTSAGTPPGDVRPSAAAGAPPTSSAQQPGFNVEDATSIDESVPWANSLRGLPLGVQRLDPLKDVTDLGKAMAGQLQSGNRFLESQTRRLAEQYAKAEDTEARGKLKGELAKTIVRHFDVRHQMRKKEIDQLEARVRRLREHLQKREAARQAIVEMRLEQFISAAEGLGWDAEFGRSRSPFRQPTSSSSRSQSGPPIARPLRPIDPQP